MFLTRITKLLLTNDRQDKKVLVVQWMVVFPVK